jgi:hypothetical protein
LRLRRWTATPGYALLAVTEEEVNVLAMMEFFGTTSSRSAESAVAIHRPKGGYQKPKAPPAAVAAKRHP